LTDDTNKPPQGNGASEDFLTVLEDGVKSVLKNKRAKSSERVAAIAAGVKLAMVRYRITEGDEKGFFS
jgi:hypothetical protein